VIRRSHRQRQANCMTDFLRVATGVTSPSWPVREAPRGVGA
jgi:hypothetical protein